VFRLQLTNVLLAYTFVACSNKLYCKVVSDSSFRYCVVSAIPMMLIATPRNKRCICYRAVLSLRLSVREEHDVLTWARAAGRSSVSVLSLVADCNGRRWCRADLIRCRAL